MRFLDGLKNLLSSLVNNRSASAANEVVSYRVPDTELRSIFRTGLGNKIIRIKNGYALKEALKFEDSNEKSFYEKRLRGSVKKAGAFMLGFGRGLVLINEIGSDLSTPVTGELGRYKLDVFSGDMVTAQEVPLDLSDFRYNQPKFYNVKGKNFHHSRVVDFRYVEPPELDLPHYRYGGVPEFELIYNQIVNDGVVERASASIIDKNSTIFYKIKGFKDALNAKQESDILRFYSLTEKARSIFGAGLIDADDDIVNIEQKLSNLDSADQITLRRLAMVTGIPLAILVGESVRGLNSTGETEKQIFNELIEVLQQDYYFDPINELMLKLGKQPVEFSDAQNITPTEKIEYDGKAIENALKLSQMGEDFNAYLVGRGVLEKNTFEEIFGDGTEDS